MSDRFSKDFINYRGASKRNQMSNGTYKTTFGNSQGTERATPASNEFMTATEKESGAINAKQFYATMAIMENQGSSNSAARANAMMLQDMASANNTSAMKILFNQVNEGYGDGTMFTRDVYTDMNQIRPPSNQIDLTVTSSNSDSFQSRNILP